MKSCTKLLIVIAALVLAACEGSISLRGNGEAVTETRTVAEFDSVSANNGVQVTLTIDPSVGGDVALEVTTDSNLQEFLTTRVAGGKLTATSNRAGGVSPTRGWDVSTTVAGIEDVSSNNGAEVNLIGSATDVALSANNGSEINAEAFEVTNAEVDADNGAEISICVTGEVSGDVANGARLKVLCGGNTNVKTSGGGQVSSS